MATLSEAVAASSRSFCSSARRELYLTKVEWSYGISGLDGAEVGAGFRSKRYPSGPLGPTKFGEKFYEGCRKLGINAMPLPMSHLTERNELGRKAVNRTSFWSC